MRTRDLFEDFHTLLVSFQSNRDSRRWIDPETGQPAWIRYELMRMFWTVNDYRSSHGYRTMVALHEVEAAEGMAAGHSDYTKKFALYCAELALRKDPQT